VTEAGSLKKAPLKKTFFLILDCGPDQQAAVFLQPVKRKSKLKRSNQKKMLSAFGNRQ
jgi:hypothetical protein